MKTVNIENRKARFNYFIEDTYTAGMMLSGDQVKSIRAGHISLDISFCRIEGMEAYAEVTMYDKRYMIKLLLNRREIDRMGKITEQPGYTLIPLKIYRDPRTTFLKMTVGICKGKKLYDKRETIKECDLTRDLRFA